MKYLIFDFGLYVSQSDALWKKEGDIVWYYTPWMSKDPHYSQYCVGKDFGHLTKILYFEDYIEQADCIIFWDVSGGSYCNYLRNKYPNKSIWGCGLGERLENDRVLLKEWCAELGLPVNKYVVCKGVTELKNYLKKTGGNKYVKVNIFRGDMESFYAKDFESADSIIDQEVIKALGCHKEEYEFIVEDPIETDVEVGFDGFFNGTDYLKPYFCGYEVHKGLYVAKVTDEMPECLMETMDAFQPLLTKMNYRGAISTEEKVVSMKEHYFIDACMRLPNPLSALYPVLIENWAEVVYNVGLGKEIDLKIKHKYVGAFPLTSIYAKDNYVKIDIKESDRDKARYQMVCGKGKDVYAIPGWEVVGILVCGGDSVDEIIQKLKDNAKSVDGHGVDSDPVNGIDIVKDVIKAGEKIGIKF